MIGPEQKALIRRLHYAEHWKIGTIAAELGLHHETVRRALETERFNPGKTRRPRLTDPYVEFVRETLQRHPRLRATRIYQMIRSRGYMGSVVQLRRVVAELRPRKREAFLRLEAFPGEEAQVDWACFGAVSVGRAQRRLSCLVLTLSWSRALALEFCFDQSMESFLRAHVRALTDWGGCPRTLVYDNLKSVVLERFGDAVRFHPRILEAAACYRFAPRPCNVGRGNEKGRVERAISYVRSSFFAARPFTTLEDFNRQARRWRDQVAHARPWPGDPSRTVAEAFQEEKAKLLPLPAHPFETDLLVPVRSRKLIYVRFDRNDYSIPPDAVGRPLTLAASDSLVRILDGRAEIARHRRSWDRGRAVTDPAHQEALLQLKRKAAASARSGRLVQAVPESEAFLEAALRRGESLGPLTRRLLSLLDQYGAEPLREALREALRRKTPRGSSAAFLLQKRRRPGGPPPPVDLSRRPELAGLHVQPHNPEDYDELSQPDAEPEPESE